MGTAQRRQVSTSDGRVLEALVSGPAEGTVLVLHTGTPGGLVPLPAGLDPAPMGIRTVLYARPGYGDSTPHPGRTVADSAGDTAAILDAVGADTFLNVGWSGGGPHALACAALLPDRCVGTATIAGLAPYVESEPSSEVRAWYAADEDNQLALAGDIDGFRRAVEDFVGQMAGVTAESVARTDNEADRRFFSEGYGEWLASYIRGGGMSGGSGAVDDCLAQLRDWAFSLAEVGRVTIWTGIDDDHVPAFHAEWLNDHLPQADLHLLEDEGHSSIVRHLPEIIAALLAMG